jgi:emp24/gp25L/p24 family/GOLD
VTVTSVLTILKKTKNHHHTHHTSRTPLLSTFPSAMSRPNRTHTTVLVLLAAVLVAAMAVSPANGLYIFLKEGETRCFIEEVPKDTLVLATYEATEHLATASAAPSGRFEDIKITSTVRDPAGKLILQRALPQSSRVAFTSQVCFSCACVRACICRKIDV